MQAIGELSAATGCKIETIRYYEKMGLLPKPARSAGGHRLYNDVHLKHLTLIRHGRELGFTLEQLRELLSLSQNNQRSCGDALTIVERHLALVKTKISELQRIKNSLTDMAKKCTTCCPSARAPNCTIMEDLIR